MPESSVEDANLKNDGKSNRSNKAAAGSQTKQETQCEHSSAVTRRQFLETAAGASILASFPPYPSATEAEGEVPPRTRARTAETIAVGGLGGLLLGKPEPADPNSILIILTPTHNGINFLDISGS